MTKIIAIETTDLTREFGILTAVDRINLQVKSGEVVGFLGPNGAGKTTTIRMLVGSLRPTKGSARIHGLDVVKEGVQARKHIGYVPEENSAYCSDLSVEAFCKYLASLRGLSGTNLKEEIREKLEIVQMKHLEKRKISKLSSGQKQRVGLAQALIGDPDVIIADEPTANLDPAGKQEMIGRIRALAHEDASRAFFISTHILTEAEALSDRILILNKGQIVADQAIHEIKERGTSQVFFVNVSDKETLQNALLDTTWAAEAKIVKGGLEIMTNQPEKLFKELPKLIAAQELSLLMFRPAKSKLESLFFELTDNNSTKNF
ncbi:MAG: ABC transporter ATP-binding protein [Candidatus Hodarchaeota archaeon]